MDITTAVVLGRGFPYQPLWTDRGGLCFQGVFVWLGVPQVPVMISLVSQVCCGEELSVTCPGPQWWDPSEGSFLLPGVEITKEVYSGLSVFFIKRGFFFPQTQKYSESVSTRGFC